MKRHLAIFLFVTQLVYSAVCAKAEPPVYEARQEDPIQFKVDNEGNVATAGTILKQPARKTYRLRAGDKLQFELLNDKYKFESDVVVDNQGAVNLEYINWVGVEGKTLEEASLVIKELYAKDYFVNPNLKLRLTEKAPIRYKILGQVANPGYYEVPPGLGVDLLDAIAIAGGYTRLAGKIILKSYDLESPSEIRNFKIKNLTKVGKNEIPKLIGGETIVIGESFF
ncbi:polysaccharide biosynthesis/export family protein [bacterium]|nr:polysaccharide biosynthesis/export family protein [bacterium]